MTFPVEPACAGRVKTRSNGPDSVASVTFEQRQAVGGRDGARVGGAEEHERAGGGAAAEEAGSGERGAGSGERGAWAATVRAGRACRHPQRPTASSPRAAGVIRAAYGIATFGCVTTKADFTEEEWAAPRARAAGRGDGDLARRPGRPDRGDQGIERGDQDGARGGRDRQPRRVRPGRRGGRRREGPAPAEPVGRLQAQGRTGGRGDPRRTARRQRAADREGDARRSASSFASG